MAAPRRPRPGRDDADGGVGKGVAGIPCHPPEAPFRRGAEAPRLRPHVAKSVLAAGAAVPSAAAVLLTVSVVIAVGYVANRLAQATRFPEVATLLLVGLALGPGNRLLQMYGYGSVTLAETLHPAGLREAAPIVSGLALVVILFEAGLGMEFRQVRSSLGPALRIAIPVLVLSSVAVAAIAHWVYGMPPIVAAVLGVALSNVGQTVSSALLRRLSADPTTKSIGLVEMALYDVVSVPILVTLFHVAGAAPRARSCGPRRSRPSPRRPPSASSSAPGWASPGSSSSAGCTAIPTPTS